MRNLGALVWGWTVWMDWTGREYEYGYGIAEAPWDWLLPGAM